MATLFLCHLRQLKPHFKVLKLEIRPRELPTFVAASLLSLWNLFTLWSISFSCSWISWPCFCKSRCSETFSLIAYLYNAKRPWLRVFLLDELIKPIKFDYFSGSLKGLCHEIYLNSTVISLQIVMVRPGTHLVKNHESQLKKRKNEYDIKPSFPAKLVVESPELKRCIQC